MRKVSGAVRAGASPYMAGANRYTATAATSAAGGAGLVLLSMLFWIIFYQNLPDNLQGMAANSTGPFLTANSTDRVVKISMLLFGLYILASRWSLTRSVVKGINPG